jgi:hypothetical protein
VYRVHANKPIEDTLKTQCVAEQPPDASLDGDASIPKLAKESHIAEEIQTFMPKRLSAL